MGKQVNLEHYITKCEEALPRSQRALEYLHSRKVGPNAISDWRIGYDPGNGFKGMAGRIVLPLLDYNYNVISATGRQLPGGRDPKYYHLPFYKSRWLYGLHASNFDYDFNIPVVVEGHFSAISLVEIGWPAYAVMGSTLSLWQAGNLFYIAAMFGQEPPYKFILFPDKDKPKSASKWKETLSRVAPVKCREGEYPLISPRDCDPDWLAQNQPDEFFEQLRGNSGLLTSYSSNVWEA